MSEPRKQLVYFIQVVGNGPIKIGVATRPWKRMADLQVACPYELEMAGYVASDDARDLELMLHGLFSAHHLRGEWFHPAREIEDYISDAMVAAEIAA